MRRGEMAKRAADRQITQDTLDEEEPEDVRIPTALVLCVLTD